MSLVRLKSIAYFISNQKGKYGFTLDYTNGNTGLYDKYLQLLSTPRLFGYYKNFLNPDLGWINSKENQEKYADFQQDVISKIMLLNPKFSYKEA